METRSAERGTRNLVLSCLAGALLAAGAGVAAFYFPAGDRLARLSYDVPFVFSSAVPSELVLIYIDAKVKKSLGEPTDVPLDRPYHTRLTEHLRQDGAKLILYDLLFDNADPNPETDAAFAAAIRAHGKVVLVADYIKVMQGNVFQQAPLLPIQVLQDAAAGWGLAQLKPDMDFAIREIDGGAEAFPSAGWVAASLLGAEVTRNPNQRLTPKWLNYYCPPVKLRAINLDHALNPDGLPAGYFRDKIVVVGARPSVGGVGAGREEFKNPFSRFGSRFSSGAEVHALTLLNLLRGDWLQRLTLRTEVLLVIMCGCVLGVGLCLFRPWQAMLAAAVAAMVVFASSVFFQLEQRVWWSWAVPVTVQTPVALFWAIGWRYLVESRKRRKLRRAFSVYLSPYMADRVAQTDFDLALGGQQVEATVMFTDLAGFTAMSEKLPPREVSTILTTYFTRTTRHILERDGTIIRYMGDGIMAVWGAPVANLHHARDAVMAACKIIGESQSDIAGRRLRTRIGINTGLVLAGNLGSEFRFDYTAIGATTNLASRLETLNKVLGTDLLISAATRRSLPEDIQVRNVGRFILSGTSEPVQVYEVLGSADGPRPQHVDSGRADWPAIFNEALECWSRQQFPAARTLLEKVIALRGGHDGPSKFYLSQLDQPWTDAIKLDTK